VQQAHPSAHYALAVSGGADSMGLLALAAQAAQLADAPQFHVLTVDHGLRREAKAEAAMVARACAKLDLPHKILTANETLGESDIQQKARLMRYRLMADYCAGAAMPLITAHHVNDQAETVAMRLAHGSGPDGLAGMAARQVLKTEAGSLTVLRPFLRHAPEALAAVAKAAGLDWVNDPSNRDTHYERVRWRQKMPQLAETGLNAAALSRLADDMRDLRGARDKALHDWLSAYAHWHDYGVLSLPRAALLALEGETRHALLGACVRYFGGHIYKPRRAALAAFAAPLLIDEAGAGVLGGVLMRWRKRDVFIGRELAALEASQPHANDTLWDGRFKMPQVAAGHFVAPLGKDGVQALRDAGKVFETDVPAAYHAVLPAIFDAKGLCACPPLAPPTDRGGQRVSSKQLFSALLQQGEGW
jgi:tRNA(Ile)-lysidine synthase